MAADRARNETAHERAGDGSVAVRKMKELRTAGAGIAGRRIAHALFARPAGLEVQSVETWQAHAPAIERRDRVDAAAPQIVRAMLIERDRRRIGLHNVEQVVLIGKAPELVLLLRIAETGIIVFGAGLDLEDAFLHPFAQRRFGNKRLPLLWFGFALFIRIDGDEPFGAECLLVEKHAALEPGVDRRIVAFLPKLRRFDAERFQQSCRNSAVGSRAIDIQRAAIDDFHAAVQVKFVALGVTAEIVMVFDYEDFRRWFRRAIEPCGRQSADSAANNGENVGFTSVEDRSRLVPEIAVAQFMRRLESAGMAAAHAKPRGWIITRHVLRFRLCRCGQLRRERAECDPDGRALEKIAPRNGPIHAKVCLLYTSPSPRDRQKSRMPSSA